MQTPAFLLARRFLVACVMVLAPVSCACDETQGTINSAVCVDCVADAASKPCEESCGPNQLCDELDSGVLCRDACAEGYAWNAVGKTCDRAVATCAEANCDTRHQICEESAGVAQCTDCVEGYVSGAGGCEAFTPCEQLDCESEHRACEEQPNGTCTRCLENFVDVDDKCVPFVGCSEKDCASENRECVEDPNGRCASCLPGLVEDDGVCRTAKTCADLDCPELCTEGEGASDAECTSGSCPKNHLANSKGQCRYCGDCGKAGVYADFTQQDHCMCNTESGEFASEGDSVRILPCDEDGDGWIRESARAAMESKDPALRGNAKCELRKVNKVILHADVSTTTFPGGGQELIELGGKNQPARLLLVESDRNDDDDELARETDAYGEQKLAANEVNGLTKFCLSDVADFNHNGLADVGEWDGQTSNSATTYQKDLQAFAYYGELHTGWYQSAEDSEYGVYHIAERPRAAGDPVAVAIRYAGDDNAPDREYWRECTRSLERAFDPEAPTVNMDFAAFEEGMPEDFPGMRHHSQFKCMRVVPNTATTDPANTPHLVLENNTKTLFGPWQAAEPTGSRDEPYRWNACVKSGTAEGMGTNPASPLFTCTAVDAPSLVAGAVGWAAVRFEKSRLGTGEGCIDECRDQTLLLEENRCESYAPGVSKNCDGDTAGFGRLTCGCNEYLGGTACEVACPPAHRHVSEDFDVLGYPETPLAARKGTWLCGNFSATQGITLEGGGYTLRGRIPYTPVNRTELTGGGYTLR